MQICAMLKITDKLPLSLNHTLICSSPKHILFPRYSPVKFG